MQVIYHRPARVIRTSIGHAEPRLVCQEDMIPTIIAMGGRARWLPERAAAEGGTTQPTSSAARLDRA